MLTTERHLFEIPIYRCPISKHTEELEARRSAWMALSHSSGNPSFASESFATPERYWEYHRWYPWRYNEIIGWLRLLRFGTQIQGELWFSSAKRIGPQPTKPMFFQGKAFEVEFDSRQTNPEIFSRLKLSIELFQKTKAMRGRFLDLECFSALSPSISWRHIMGFDGGV